MSITIDKVGGSSNSKHAEILGNSKATKPTDNINVNDIYIELDTLDAYYWDGSQWQVMGEDNE